MWAAVNLRMSGSECVSLIARYLGGWIVLLQNSRPIRKDFLLAWRVIGSVPRLSELTTQYPPIRPFSVSNIGKEQK